MAESKPKTSGRARSPRAGKRSTAKSAAKSSPAKSASRASSKPASKPASKVATKSAAKTSLAKKELPRKAGSGKPKPAPDLPARIDGLRGWLDQIERRQGRMTYIGAAGLLIALATAGVALYLGISAQQDDARKSDLDEVNAKISTIQAGTEASVDNKLKALNDTIAALQQRVTAAEQKAQQAQQAAAAARNTAVTPSAPIPTPIAPSIPNTKPPTGGSKP